MHSRRPYIRMFITYGVNSARKVGLKQQSILKPSADLGIAAR